MINLIQINNDIDNDECDLLAFDDEDKELIIAFVNFKLYSMRNNIKEYSNHIIRHDYIYKKLVKYNANNKCQITGVNSIMCEVAHILPFSKCKNDIERYDPYNGLYIDCSIHKLLDNTNYLSIEIDNDNYYIVVNENNILDTIVKNQIKSRLGIADATNRRKINNINKASNYYIKKLYVKN